MILSALSSPSGPRPRLWGMTQLRAMRQDYLGFVAGLQADYPDIAQVQVFNERINHVFRPEWVRDILVNHADSLIRWERATQVFSQSMGQSVLVTEGAVWERQRKMLQPGFTPKHVAGYAGLMIKASQVALDRVSPGMVDVEALMTRTTLDVILRTLFGQHQRSEADVDAVGKAIQTLSHYGFSQFFRPVSWPLWAPLPSVRRARAAQHTLTHLIEQHIALQEARGNQESEDLLSMLRLARNPEHPDQGFSATELHDQTMVMFQAGHETTATALTWWCGLIAQHPEIGARIALEVKTVLQGQDPSPASLGQLPCLQASLKEALRLYPPASILFSRRACKDITVGPWTIRQGQLIAITPYLIQRDPRWFDAPNEFRPERFLLDAPEITRGAWLAFGTGPRVCIGQHFALLEMGIIAAMLMQRFSLHWPTNTAWPKGNLAVTLRPAQAMRLVLKAR